MKKTFLAMCVLGCSSLLFAQDPVTPTPRDTTVTETTTPETTTPTTPVTTETDMSTQRSVGDYPAYSATVNVPSNISYSFNTDYPGTANVNWHQRGQWYRASYNREGRTMHTYYAPNGKSFNVALPVLRGDIPDEMINRAVSQYGDRLYAINSTRTGKGDVAYRVTLIDDSNTGMDNTAMNQNSMNNNTTTGTTQYNSDYRGLYFGPTRYEYFGEDGTTIQEIDMYRTETEDPNDPQNMNNNQNLNNNNGTINNNNNKPTGYKKAKAKNSFAATTKKSSSKA